MSDNYLFFNSIENFNDPFDSNINLFDFSKFENSKKELRKLKDKEEEFKKEINTYKVCCFTRDGNNMLMWGHYANSHKGVCLGFNPVSKGLDALDMHYTKDFTKAVFFPFDEDKIHHVFYSKSFEWEYEKEMRVVKSGLKDGKFIFDTNDLFSICFGLNFNKKDKKEVLCILLEKYPHIRIFQASLANNSYGLIYTEESIPVKNSKVKLPQSKRLEKKKRKNKIGDIQSEIKSLNKPND